MNARIIALATLLAGSAAAQTLTTIYSFGSDPAGLTAGPGGVLYGTMAVSPGSVYSLTPPTSSGGSWTYTNLRTFGPLAQGEWPAGAVAIGKGGVLFGATQGGGQYCIECGTVYQLTPPTSAGGAWAFEVIYSFGGPGTIGTFPTAGVVVGSNGVVYGSTSFGGSGNSTGTIYSLTPPASSGGSWTYATLHSFTGGSDGSDPIALRVVPGGLLGTASGGALGQGTIFALTPPTTPGNPWTFTTIYTFTGGGDGATPTNLLPGKGEILYGAASTGGGNGQGTVFSLTPPAVPGVSWTFTTLYTFTGNADGGYPLGVVAGLHGNLFGSAVHGGSEGVGVVFKLIPPVLPDDAWSELTLANFNYNDAYPYFGVTFGFEGALYGITFDVGLYGITGSIFSLAQ